MRYKVKESNISKLITYLKIKTNEVVSNDNNRKENKLYKK